MSRTRIEVAKLQKRRFILKGDSLCFHVTRNTLQIIFGQFLDCRFFGFADPGNLQFHNLDLNTPG